MRWRRPRFLVVPTASLLAALNPGIADAFHHLPFRPTSSPIPAAPVVPCRRKPYRGRRDGGSGGGVVEPSKLRMGLGDFLRDFGKELDNLIDDAMDRKLGGGSTFYGERKSSFSRSKKSYRDMAMGEAYKREVARMENSAPWDGGNQGGSEEVRRGGTLSGEELRNIIEEKWGRRYPVLIKRRRDALGEPRLYLVVQWKFVGKANLDLTEEEYVAESDAVAALVTEWGAADAVRDEIRDSAARPKTMTQQYPGLFVPLDVEQIIVDTW